MGYRVICNPNQWTEVFSAAGPIPFWKNVIYVDPAFTRLDIQWRSNSGGPWWWWWHSEGRLPVNNAIVFWYTPELVYLRLEVLPIGGGPATVDVI